MNNTDWNKTYMGFARLVAEHSKADKAKVGCVIVKENQVISSGYNGTPSGYDNTCEDREFLSNRLVTRPEVIHAEINAIAKVARSTISCEGADLYVTKAPCFECAKAIIQSGISMVIFKGSLEECEQDSIAFLQVNNVVVIVMNEEGGYLV